MSAPEYGKYAKEVLGPQMKPEVLSEVLELEEKEDFENPRYEERLMTNYYVEHVLRIPLEDWPDPILRTFNHLNHSVYTIMQGPSEFGIRGLLETWDRTADIQKIKVPTLVIGATYDTMDPKHMEWVASQLEKGEFLLCPNGSHLCNYDDHEVYFEGVIKFIKNVDMNS